MVSWLGRECVSVVEEPCVVAHQRLQLDLLTSPAGWMQAHDVQPVLLNQELYSTYLIVNLPH
jgi:hypothetical protein